MLCRDTQESLKQSGFGLAQDLHLITSDWGFEPTDVTCVYHGPFHIWHGDEDNLVPISLQRMIKNLVSNNGSVNSVMSKQLRSTVNFDQ